MTCEHCENNKFTTDSDSYTRGVTLDFAFDHTCGDAGCAVSVLCPCDCHLLNVVGANSDQ